MRHLQNEQNEVFTGNNFILEAYSTAVNMAFFSYSMFKSKTDTTEVIIMVS